MSPGCSHVGFVELPFEVSTSFQKGAAFGPRAIMHELKRLDGFDFMLGRDPFKNVHSKTIRPYEQGLRDPLFEQAYAARAVADLLDAGGFPIALGGEHTVSLGPIRVARMRGPLGILQLDAHADLRHMYEGNYMSHACVMRRALEMSCALLNVGVRTMCAEEVAFVKEARLKQVDGRTAANTARTDWYRVIDDLPERIYLTVDMDVFNPEDVPAVGTPEPGGPGYEAIVDFLSYVFKAKEVVAADLVELMPGGRDAASIRLAARLIGVIVGFKFGS
jgi:agmatinase